MYIHLSKTIEYTTPSMNCNVKYVTWVMMMWRFISCNQCTTLVGDVGNGGGCACGVEGRDITEQFLQTSDWFMFFSARSSTVKYEKSKQLKVRIRMKKYHVLWRN